MHQILGRLGQIPLQVATESRVIVQDAQSQRPLPTGHVAVTTLSEP